MGGQGVYTRHLTKAIADLGHHVEVLGGQPYPELDERVPLVKLPSLDIYNDHYPLRMPWIGELSGKSAAAATSPTFADAAERSRSSAKLARVHPMRLSR